ncbi:glycosyl hydrolase 53 family protein [Xylanibacter ruminicola]|uniref:Arabinogalactan endo-beta-1,4-galactanase n=1 Tax=Xylanibacter ruminicola TaxID=839 RepID=A0A1M6WYN1_XYLRU|nr:glycosyl hydrolase 53 family protein [Xylanibacter ruminicola]SHK98882.1 arabinogalactan endo-1,4-beta-galactosidase [Xylanibacter ruminicola]
MKLLKLLLVTALLCSTNTLRAQKYVGGDVSLLSRYEENGANYKDKNGQSITDVLTFLKEQGMNTMRVRLFVDPNNAPSDHKGQGVCQDLDYVKKLGKKIKDAGLKLILDFHYSDTWADPGNQGTPASWIMINTPTYEYIYTYTKESLQAMVDAGATPDFIQTGNEISFGMLWDGCKISANSAWNAYLDTNWDHLATALKNASKACREVCPEAKIIIHTEQCANNPTLDVAFYNRVKDNEVDYDIIGVSYYPYYKGPISNLNNGLTKLENNFPEKKIMVVETGCSYHYKMVKKDGESDNEEAGYPLTYEGQRQYTEDLITMLNNHELVIGLFWWFLEANEYGLDWNTKRVTDHWYNASLFDNETGKALPALYELKNFSNGSSSAIQGIAKGLECDNRRWYSLDGKMLKDKPSKSGIYINNNQKIVTQ